MPKAQMAPVKCPECQGPMYDNIADKAAGKRGPRAPDYACKDKDGCGHGIWLKDSEKNALQGQQAAKGAPAGQRPPLVLDSCMDACLTAARDILARSFKTAIDPALEVNMATTLYISRSENRGILKVEKQGILAAREKAAERKRKEAEAAEAERLRREQDEAAHAGGDSSDPMWSPDNDDLPF